MSLQTLVLVTGFPATGKSTLAEHIAPKLGLPLVAKDTIKEALYEALGAGDVAASKRLSGASYEVMFAVATQMQQVLLEANFEHARSEQELLALHPRPVEVFVRCDPDEAVRRYRERDRGAPHFDREVADELEAKLREQGQHPLALGGPVLEVDTTVGVDEDAVVSWVREQISEQREQAARA